MASLIAFSGAKMVLRFFSQESRIFCHARIYAVCMFLHGVPANYEPSLGEWRWWCTLAYAIGRLSGRSFATPENRLRSG